MSKRAGAALPRGAKQRRTVVLNKTKVPEPEPHQVMTTEFYFLKAILKLGTKEQMDPKK
jgi:hypothetical protein